MYKSFGFLCSVLCFNLSFSLEHPSKTNHVIFTSEDIEQNVVISKEKNYLCKAVEFEIRPGSNVAESEVVLDPRGQLTLHWLVDYNHEQIFFELIFSNNSPPFNWFALGFSDRGEIPGADLCLVWIDYKGKEHFEDTHVDKRGYVHRDYKQNCNNFKVDRQNGILSFNRNFETCDDYDYVIEDGTTHILWARGSDTLFSSENLFPKSAQTHDRGFVRVRLLSALPIPKPESHEIKFANNKLSVPKSDTTYWCKVHRLPDFVNEKKHHIVQFESTITRGNEGLVHHMELFYCDTDADAEIPVYEGSCFDATRPNITKVCSKVKAAWAMGATPFAYPEAAGLPLGGPNANKYVMLEVHYNNPEMRDDWVDSSGITIYVTPKLRKFDAAIMELGLEYIDKMAVPSGQPAFPLTGYCVPECTSVGLPSRGIIVFGSQLHTHLTGVLVRTRHFRNGEELPILNQDKHYSTHFQEIRLLRKFVHVRPGDLLTTTCLYDTRDRQHATIGGHAITDEMCVNYMHYYPATALEVCKSSVSTQSLNNYFNFEKSLDRMNTSSHNSPRANFLAISPWTPLRAQALRRLYAEEPLSMQCNRSDGTRFQGHWEEFPLPRLRSELPAEGRRCRSRHPERFERDEWMQK